MFIPNGIAPVRWRKRPGGEVRALHPVLHRVTLCGPLARTGVRGGFAAHSERQGGPEAIRIKLVGQCRMVDGGSDRFADSAASNRAGSLRSRSYARRWRSSAEAILRSCWHPSCPFRFPPKLTTISDRGEDPGHRRRRRHLGSHPRHRLGAGVRLRDIDGIEAFIHEEMAAQGSATPAQKAGLARFDARRITEELASHLDRVARMAPADAPAADARHSRRNSLEAGTVRFRILEEMVERFAELTGDRSALHVSEAFARRSAYRRPVVHGMLPVGFIALIDRFRLKAPLHSVAISGHFSAPVYIGDRLVLSAGVAVLQARKDAIDFNYVVRHEASGAIATGES